MTDINQHEIAQFNERHDVGMDDQFKQLCEEIGELAEALQSDANDEVLAEELADVIFVARSMAELRNINVTAAVNHVTAENLEKTTSTEGEKVTKEGLESEDEQQSPR